LSTPHTSGAELDRVRANMTGAYVAIAGVVIFTIAVFLDWATPEGEEAGFSGYESDSLLPFAAFLGIGFAVALLYAASRAYRRQHRGLSLASMAVGLAVTLQSLAWILDVPGAAERQSELSADIGSWVGLVGAVVWTVGSGMLANEPEGDPERDRVYDRHEDGRRRR
jgi:ABC-type Fe3+-siderophore transport system permease subunit